jgi:signal transduction histidine kinase
VLGLDRLTTIALVVGAVVVVALIAAAVAASRSGAAARRHQAIALSAIDFVRTSFASRFARGELLQDLLGDLVAALREAFQLDAAEIWTAAPGHLQLTSRDPPADEHDIVITAAEQAVLATAQVSGAAWAKIWLPALLPSAERCQLRVAPIAEGGELLGLIAVERGRRGDRLAAEIDDTLRELGRELALAMRRARMESALRDSLIRLRTQAEDLRASRARVVVAADAERRRIERDLHDGAQQLLVAVAVKARLAQQLRTKDPVRASTLLEELIGDVQKALEDLRSLGHGIFPPLLASGGLPEALPAAARRAALPVRVRCDGIARYSPDVEAAAYFCCLEALQNAAKHSGEGRSASVHLHDENGSLVFEVVDDGAGFDPTTRATGAGLASMRDRVGAVGGTIIVESSPGRGTRVRGQIPPSP